MNLLERVLTLLRANLNTLVEKADDPEKVLRQLQLDMRNQLMQFKTQVATAIAESRNLQTPSNKKKPAPQTSAGCSDGSRGSCKCDGGSSQARPGCAARATIPGTAS